MPTYTFINSKTKEEWTDIMSISDMEELTKKKTHFASHKRNKYSIKYRCDEN